MPPLSSLEITPEKVWSSNTGRNASGKLVGDWKTTKYTLKCSWSGIGQEEAATISAAISASKKVKDEDDKTIIVANQFSVTFYDPAQISNGKPKQVTKPMYSGSPVFTVKSYATDDRPVYDVKVDLIEI